MLCYIVLHVLEPDRVGLAECSSLTPPAARAVSIVAVIPSIRSPSPSRSSPSTHLHEEGAAVLRKVGEDVQVQGGAQVV